ncbi:Ig-like domain-containing protein [Zobellia uliginosa]|nr:Ig-like domain-containing protein [Zobellia uliginosa]
MFIDENNVCIAVGLGTAEVTVTSVSNPEASDTVTVVVIEADRIPVTGITVSQEDPGATGTERQLLATVLPEEATDPSVTWSSSDDTIASIDDNGLLTGLSAGTATITATSVSDPEISGSIQIEITGVSLLSANNIETFALKDQIETATIDPVTHTVSITVLEGTPLNVAPIMLTVSEGATIAPGLLQARDFSSPVEYTVTSGNGTEQVWTVNAKVLTIPVAGETNITGFELAGQNSSTINTTDRTVTVNVPDGTDLNVAPQVLEVSPDATVAPAIGQVQDFSEAVTYTVTPETGTPQVWTVNVTVSQPAGSGDNAITGFELPNQTEVDIDEASFLVTVTVPDGTALNSAPSVLNVSANATVNPARSVVQDFSGAVTYTVTAENGTPQEWTVNVTVLPPTGSGANAITAFSLPEQNSSVIDTDNHTVTVNVADGTYLFGQPAELEISQGATIDPLPTAERDFTDPTPYMVTSENGTEQEWIVNVNVLPPTGSGDNAITGFALPVQNSADIDAGNNTITVNVADGTDLNVAPQNLTLSPNATILPAIDAVQDFNTEVIYTVTAENGTAREWTVNVTVSAPTGSDENTITRFELDGQTDVIVDDTTSTITVTVPNGTDLNTAPSVLDLSDNATVNPAIGDIQDFSSPVTYNVTAENGDTQEWMVNVTVTENQAPVVNDDTTAVELGETVRINVIDNDSDVDNPNSELVISGVLGVQPENAGSFTIEGQEIVFTSSGDYTGDATFGYTINDGNVGNDASATVTVTIFETEVKVTGVSVTPNTATITVGNNTALTANVLPTNASNKNVTWSSSNTAFATVSATGAVTAVSPGTATITVTTEDGSFTATSAITVEAPTVPVTGVSVTPNTATITVGNNTALTANVLPANASNKNVTWSSSNTAFATVSATGQVTGVSPGTAIITVTTQDGNFTATSTITVNGIITFARSTGRYTAPAGSAVEVGMLTYIDGKGVASLRVNTESGNQGVSLLNLGYSFNLSSVNPIDNGFFTMPANGEVYFSGLHSDIDQDRFSTTEITIFNNQGRTEVINMDASTPIQ